MPSELLIVTSVVTVIGLILAVSTATFKGGKWVGSVNSDREAIKEFMREIREKINQIFERLPPVTESRGSPLRLTDLGETVSETLSAKDWADSLLSMVLPSVEGKRPFEVQEFCLEYVVNDLELSDDQDALIRFCVYEHGITREQVLRVLALELRDLLLGEAGEQE